jgi:hypothetical protein
VRLPAVVIRLELEMPPCILIEAEEDARRLIRWLEGNDELLSLVERAQASSARPGAKQSVLRSLEEELDLEVGLFILTFGRHRGRTIGQVYADDPSGDSRDTGAAYIRWLGSDSIKDSVVRTAARRFLEQTAPELLDR